MSLIDRLFGRGPAGAAPMPRIEPAPPAAMAAETSGTLAPQPWMTEVGWRDIGGRSRVKTLPPVNPTAAQRHATVFACCSVIAGDLSKVPLHLYQRDARGREARVREHALNYLLNVESVPGVAACVTRLSLIYAFALRGNAFAYAPRDGAGEVTLVETVRGQQPMILAAGRDRFYDFEDGEGVRRRVPHRHMVHLRYLAEDGWTGRSPIEVAAESVGIALAGQEAAARTSSGAWVRAVIKMADTFDDDEEYQRRARRIADSLRNPEMEGFPVMGSDDGVEKLDLSASDQQLLESRKFDALQLCAIYRMPPSKVQSLEHGVKANVEQQAIDYLTDCLLHWGTAVEGQLGLSLLTPGEREAGLFLRHDFDALLRTTTKERYEAHARAVGGPWKTVNESRVQEGLDEIEGGDVLYPPPNQNGTERQGNAAPAEGSNG